MNWPGETTKETRHTIQQLTAFAHVADLERSIRFYGLLGLPMVADWDHDGVRVWALLESGTSRLMLAQAAEPIEANKQAVLLYGYSENVAELRSHLVDSGLQVPPLRFPDHMTAGEIRLEDPDGYVVLVGQLEP